MKNILMAVESEKWDGSDLAKLLNENDYNITEAKTSTILFEELKNNLSNFDVVIINQTLIGLEDVENHIVKLRNVIPIKANVNVIFTIHKEKDKFRHHLIRENFFNFLVYPYNFDDIDDLIYNSKNYDDVKSYLIREVEKTYEKKGGKLNLIKEKLINTKILPNKIVAFYGETATQTMLNVSKALSKDEDLKILLIDFNSNCHLTYLSLYDKYFGCGCLSEVIESIKRGSFNKNSFKQYVSKTKIASNVHLLPHFKNFGYMNVFDFDEALQMKYIEKILLYAKANYNLVLIDLPRYFYLGSVVDTLKESDIVYFLSSTYFPCRFEMKNTIKYLNQNDYLFDNIEDLRLIVTKASNLSSVSSKMVFNELKDIEVASDDGKILSANNVFKDYIEIPKIDGIDEIVEQNKYMYDVTGLDRYKEAINDLAKDIYYFAGGGDIAKKSRGFFEKIRTKFAKS